MFDDLPTDFFNLNADDWIFHIISAPNAQNLLIACWFIWLSRNAEIFRDKVWPAWLVVNKYKSLMMLVQDTQVSDTSSSSPRLVPPDQWFKLNIDGSSLGNLGASGFGGIIRDSLGSFIIGFSGYCGHTTSVHAELFASGLRSWYPVP